MRYKLQKSIAVGILLAAGLALPAMSQDRPEDRFLREAKLLIFDAQWAAALDKLESILSQYPASPATPQVLFYRAECLSRAPGRAKDALRAYQDYLKTDDRNESLIEQAEVSIIDLSYGLYALGDKDAAKDIVGRLANPNKAVKYYAAYKLSAVKDKAVAAKSIPVLQRIISTETNPELTDRARIALLRVSPKSLEGVERRPDEPRTKVLRILITGEGTSRVDLSIPLALADLALQAISDSDKAMMRRKGYDLDRILRDLARSGGSILEIRGAEGEGIIKIWIETRK
ncbi:MAG: hypothetical protein A2Y56_11140 [Candidatus Aminicenantes bacterium RBG_13_63_10]|nr:MAG: hypothetical protein A2Y56_11140 [Candidatus Aminicenantes bacterium RBG_13_63_10]